MRLVYQPEVTLLACSVPQAINETPQYARSNAERQASLTSIEGVAEFAGRICYDSFEGGRSSQADYFDNIKKSGHGSVLEHLTATVLLSGVSRSLTHELIRHRAGFGFSQASQRYIDYSVASRQAIVVPPGIIGEPNALVILRDGTADSFACYTQLLSRLNDRPRKKACEIARAVLPNAVASEIVVTANARAWRHFIELRNHLAADEEMRRAAYLIGWALRRLWPTVMGDYDFSEPPGMLPPTRGSETPTRKI